MRYYNTQDWLRPLLLITKSDTIRRLRFLLLFVAAFTAVIVYIEKTYLNLGDSSLLRNLPVMHSLLGFAISMLLVFRTNSAYDRWWEGRKLWGSLVNNCRNLAIKLNAMLKEKNDREFFEKCIRYYPGELMLHLLKESTKLALDDLESVRYKSQLKSDHTPVEIVILMQNRIQQLYEQGKITGDQLIILNPEIQSLLDICGACERIKNTPIPYSYSSFIKKFIFIYTLSLPFGFAFNLAWLAIPVVTFIFYVLASLEIIAEEIEDPFGLDPNDLPLETISGNIAVIVEAIFHEDDFDNVYSRTQTTDLK